jgi:hypothetical protein
LPELRAGKAKLEACHAYLSRGAAGDDCGIRYLLRITRPGEPATETRVLTGRVHRDEDAAAADFKAASKFRERPGLKGLRIPEPLAQLTAERRLVLYNFDPWMNLWQYHAYHEGLRKLQRSARRAGTSLALIHRRALPAGPVESVPGAERFQAMVAGVERALGQLPYGSEQLDRFRNVARRVRDDGIVSRPASGVSIHGALGWDCLHYGVDGTFYFYRFEGCHESEPAIDLGGFAADLLRFTLVSADTAAYRDCCDELLTAYNAKAEYAIDRRHLPFYVVLALGERLREARTPADREELLNALDALALPGPHAR